MGGYYGNPWLHQSDINKIHSEQAFQDKRTELKSNIANLTAKYSTLLGPNGEDTPESLRVKYALTQAELAKGEFENPPKTPGAMQHFEWLLHLSRRPQAQSVTTQTGGFAMPAAAPGSAPPTVPDQGTNIGSSPATPTARTMAASNPPGLIAAGNIRGSAPANVAPSDLGSLMQQMKREAQTLEPNLPAGTAAGLGAGPGPATPGKSYTVTRPAMTPGQLKEKLRAGQKAQQETGAALAAAPLSLGQKAEQEAQAEVEKQNALANAKIDWLVQHHAPPEVIQAAVEATGGATAKATPLTGTKPYKGADGRYYQAMRNPDGTISAEPMPEDYAPPPPTRERVRAWTRDASGRIVSVLLDRQTNEPIPGTKNADILPPPYLTEHMSSGVYHWVDEDNQVHETPETRTTQPVLPSGGEATRPGALQTPGTASAQGSKPPADRILGTKGSGPLNKARSDLAEAVKLSSLADQVATKPNDAVNQKRLAVALERASAGRFTVQALGYIIKAGWGKTIEQWANNPTTGALPADVLRQLVDGAHQNLTAAMAEVNAMKSSPNDLKNQANKSAFPNAPDIGTMETADDGKKHRYMGGNPGDQNSWPVVTQ